MHYIQLRQSRKKGWLGHLVPLQAQLTRYRREIRYPIVGGKTTQCSTVGRWEESHRIGFRATFFDLVRITMSAGHSGDDTRSSTPGSQTNGPCLPESKNHLIGNSWSTGTHSSQPFKGCVCLAWFSTPCWQLGYYYTGYYSRIRRPRMSSFFC